jgi:SOS-response transcriptional repressor LexA
MDPIRDFVDRRLRELELDYKQVSLEIGRNHAYLQQYIKRGVPRFLPETVRPALARLLRCEEERLRPVTWGRAARELVASEKSVVAPSAARQRKKSRTAPSAKAAASAPPRWRPPPVGRAIPGDELVGLADLPIYGSAHGGPSGMIMHPDAIERVKRPGPLAGVAKGFGVYVVGDSMSPAYEHGDLILVHPGRPPRRGDDVLLLQHEPDGDVAALVKRLLRWTDKNWHVEQFNPRREFVLPRAAWQEAYVVVGKYNRR